jgi:hypothetical protein
MAINININNEIMKIIIIMKCEKAKIIEISQQSVANLWRNEWQWQYQ